MTSRNAKAVRVDSLIESNTPGAFKFYTHGDVNPAGLNFRCPCGCGEIYGCNFTPGGWTWDGNRDAPTVTPSLGCHSTDGKPEYHWHGFLTAGEFKEC